MLTQKVDSGDFVEVLRYWAAIGSQVLDRLQTKKLYHLIRPIHLGLLALIERSKDADAEVRGQKLADIKNIRSSVSNKDKKSENIFRL